MYTFLRIIKSDYLQRTRSYAFLITLCVSLAIAYTFVPEPTANYSTIRISGYVGFYNSAWFGYVTAIMTSVFLSLIGFYLVNSSIQKDIDTKVGQIFATTSITNFKYLLSKILSNFLVLLTIVGMVLIMSILLFFLRNDGFSFEPLQFIIPYLLVTLPALFMVSVLAVVFEMLFGKYSILQNVSYFILFSVLMAYTPKTEMQFSRDIFGDKIVMSQLVSQVKSYAKDTEDSSLNIGYSLNNEPSKKFLFEGIDFPTSFVVSRLGIVGLGVLLIWILSVFFHRFNVKERTTRKKITKTIPIATTVKEVILLALPPLETNYHIGALLKTELLLIFRKGPKWLWIINIIGMVLLVVLPLKLAHQMLLPILWFLQVGRLSDITTKELTHNAHYFSYASYKPIGRLLITQLLSAIILMILLALPLLIRLGISQEVFGLTAIVLGGICIVLIASIFGMISKSKKLFEVLFFMITYANINGIPFLDYFGAFPHSPWYIPALIILILAAASGCLLKRKLQLEQ